VAESGKKDRLELNMIIQAYQDQENVGSWDVSLSDFLGGIDGYGVLAAGKALLEHYL
jgi:hypothetical protein